MLFLAFLPLFVGLVLLELIIRIVLFVFHALLGQFLKISEESRLSIVAVSVSKVLAQKVNFLPIFFLLLPDISESLDIGPVLLDLLLFELVHSVHGIYFGNYSSSNLVELDFPGEIFRLVEETNNVPHNVYDFKYHDNSR